MLRYKALYYGVTFRQNPNEPRDRCRSTGTQSHPIANEMKSGEGEQGPRQAPDEHIHREVHSKCDPGDSDETSEDKEQGSESGIQAGEVDRGPDGGLGVTRGERAVRRIAHGCVDDDSLRREVLRRSGTVHGDLGDVNGEARECNGDDEGKGMTLECWSVEDEQGWQDQEREDEAIAEPRGQAEQRREPRTREHVVDREEVMLVGGHGSIQYSGTFPI